jgi:hypothetical protein
MSEFPLGETVRQLALIVIVISLIEGFAHFRIDPRVTTDLTPENAKAAIIEMLSSREKNSDPRFDVDGLRRQLMFASRNGLVIIAPFQVDLRRHTYRFYRGGNPPGDRPWIQEFGGVFTIKQNKWIATPIRIMAES